jgi:hypothetical protein
MCRSIPASHRICRLASPSRRSGSAQQHYPAQIRFPGRSGRNRLSLGHQNGSADLGLRNRIVAERLLRYKTPEFLAGLCFRLSTTNRRPSRFLILHAQRQARPLPPRSPTLPRHALRSPATASAPLVGSGEIRLPGGASGLAPSTPHPASARRLRVLAAVDWPGCGFGLVPGVCP